MRFFDGRVFRLLIFPVLFVCSVLWFLIAYRLLALPFLIAVIVLYACGQVGVRRRWLY